MKKVFLLLALVSCTSILFVSCLDDNDDYVQLWYSFSSLIKDNSTAGFYFDLDSGGKLIPTNNLDVSDFSDSCRVLVTYAIESDTLSGEDRIVEGDIQIIEEILTKNIIQLTEDNIDSIGSDLIIANEDNIWTSENHLNLIFWYYGYNQTHYINLAKPIGTQVDDNGNQILELRHNANNDIQSYYYQNEVSFDMRSLQEPGMDSLNFVLRAIEGETNNFEYYGTFHFNNSSTEKAATKRKVKQKKHNILVE